MGWARPPVFPGWEEAWKILLLANSHSAATQEKQSKREKREKKILSLPPNTPLGIADMRIVIAICANSIYCSNGVLSFLSDNHWSIKYIHLRAYTIQSLVKEVASDMCCVTSPIVQSAATRSTCLNIHVSYFFSSIFLNRVLRPATDRNVAVQLVGWMGN